MQALLLKFLINALTKSDYMDPEISNLVFYQENSVGYSRVYNFTILGMKIGYH